MTYGEQLKEKQVEFEGKMWNPRQDMHWFDGSIAPGLWRVENSMLEVKREGVSYNKEDLRQNNSKMV